MGLTLAQEDVWLQIGANDRYGAPAVAEILVGLVQVRDVSHHALVRHKPFPGRFEERDVVRPGLPRHEAFRERVEDFIPGQAKVDGV
ncbi:hypothetical protein D3C85_1497080 [compost metagenome]